MVGPCIGSMGHLTTITNRKDQNVIKIGENVLLFDLALISGQMTIERIFGKHFFVQILQPPNVAIRNIPAALQTLLRRSNVLGRFVVFLRRQLCITN